MLRTLVFCTYCATLAAHVWPETRWATISATAWVLLWLSAGR
jgi:hypothetical protein